MTERVLFQVQAAEMGFLQRVYDLTLERSQLRWFGHVSRMERLARHVLLAIPTGKGPGGRPRTT